MGESVVSLEQPAANIYLARSIFRTTVRDMEPINNFIKGYSKVNHLEDQRAAPSPSSHNRKKPLVIVVSVLIVGAVVGAVGFGHHYSAQSPPESPTLPSASSSSSSYADSVKTICNVTQYPVSCLSAFSVLNASQKLDPEVALRVSLEISLAHLSNLSSLPKTLILRGGKDRPSSEAALRDCESLLEDAAEEVNKAMSAMTVEAGERMLTDAKVGDMRTWVSSAMTDMETCLDGLEEMNSSVAGEVKKAMQYCNELTSNSLAILANIKVLLHNFNLSMH